MSKVPHKDIIKFTIVQLVSLAVLYVVKSSAIGISCEFYFVYRSRQSAALYFCLCPVTAFHIVLYGDSP